MMKIALIFLLWGCCGPAQSSVIQRPQKYYSSPKTWQDARAQCQSEGLELVTIVTQSEMDQKDMNEYYAWVGLKKYTSLLSLTSGWYWYDGQTHYTANTYFVQYEPGNNDDCAAAKYKCKGAVGEVCEQKHFFFCHYEDSGRKFRFIPETKSWDQAFKFCQNSGQVLAILNDWNNSPSDDKKDFPVWTGLYHDNQTWRWSDGELSDYRNWTLGFDPSNSSGPGLCGSVFSQNKSMSVQNCSDTFPYLCYSQNILLVRENRTWEEAVGHCRSLNAVGPYKPHHLLSVEPSELIYAHYQVLHNQTLNNQTSKVWLGLRFLGGSWFWSNGEVVSLPGLPSCPESRLSCGALVLHRILNGSEPEPTIEPTDCTERLNLLCYGI